MDMVVKKMHRHLYSHPYAYIIIIIYALVYSQLAASVFT